MPNHIERKMLIMDVTAKNEFETRILKVYEEIGKHFYEENKDKVLSDATYIDCFKKLSR